jgi:hypothetical protein
MVAAIIWVIAFVLHIEKALLQDGVNCLILDGVQPEAQAGGNAVHQGKAGQALGAINNHLKEKTKDPHNYDKIIPQLNGSLCTY